ncbi:hypothetical protein AX774_g5860, partial [Zancudomyces culisetae]
MPAGQERRLHDDAGPPRCVPAHQDRGEVSKALEILLEGGALSIQGAPFWPDGITICFHEGGQSNNSLDGASWYGDQYQSYGIESPIREIEGDEEAVHEAPQPRSSLPARHRGRSWEGTSALCCAGARQAQ